MQSNRVADRFAKRLYAAGCRYAFGMPGGEVLTLLDAFERAGIQFILVKHENAAGFMAEAVWQLTNAPAIVLATIGPGALNAVNAIGNAHQDRVPMIMVSGCVDADTAQCYTHQVLDHQAVFAPITKATFRLTAASVDLIADKAVATARAPRPGPVFIDVPISVAAAEATTPERLAEPRPLATAPMAGPDLQRAQSWLAASKAPVIIAGVDVINERAERAVQHFAEHHDIPVITTYKAKGVLPETHRLSLGAAGLSPLADTHLLPFVTSRDLILCVGYDPIEMRPGWQSVWNPSQTNVIDIAAEPNRHGMHQATMSIVSDTAAALAVLSGDLPAQPPRPDTGVAALRAGLAQAFPRDEAWGPAAVIDTAMAQLPADSISTVDSGAHRILLSQMWCCREARQLLQSSALCTMGCAVPLAIGSALIEPERTVVSFSGDAGFLMVAGELATAAELGLRPIFVVFVDRSLALIELKQRQSQMSNRGVDFARHDVAALGRALGGYGAVATNRAELQEALTAALSADRFTVIAAEIDRGAYDGRL